MNGHWQAPGRFCAALLLTAAVQPAIADPAERERGRQLAAVCAGCHARGEAAAATERFPDLWQLSEPALLQRLLDYRQDLGGPTLMNRIARGYTPAELALIAAAIAAGQSEDQP